MRMEMRHLLVLVLGGLMACSTEVRTVPAPVGAPANEAAPVEETTEETTADEEPFELFGKKLGKGEETRFEALLENPTTYRGKTVITSGVVRQNCQKKGCWMDVRPEGDRTSTASMTVRFKDYGFFVPLNSRGARVRMEGIVSVTTMTPEEVQHMEEEGAEVSGKKADGSAEVVEFTASGVELRGRKK
jgi:hypothetical protein